MVLNLVHSFERCQNLIVLILNGARLYFNGPFPLLYAPSPPIEGVGIPWGREG